jgi:hypothetical protein
MAKLSTVLALTVIILLPVAVISAWYIRSNQTGDPEEVDIAIKFLKNSPTFSFDGVEDSINVISVDILESFPVQYVITISFECTHAGYGDRTGQVLAQVITPHSVKITVVEGEVVNAVIDNKWDMIKQEEKFQSELLPLQYVRDLAIQYVLTTYSYNLSIPEQWESNSLTTPELMGRTIHQYLSENWVINISHPVVANPLYTVKIMHQGEASFTWEGTIDLAENIEEVSYNTEQKILFQEDAGDLVVLYIIANYEQFSDFEAPEEWVVEDLTPENLVGYSTKRFTANGWTLNISNPVVWKPVYQVELEYAGDLEYTWQGTVDQTGTVKENN